MGRPVAPRRDYVRDAQTLQRIVIAVQDDESRSQEWRRQQVEHLTQVIVAFNTDATKDRSPSPAEIEHLTDVLSGSDKPRRIKSAR